MNLTNDQQKAKELIENFLTSYQKVFTLKGYAGTGKTTLANEILKPLRYSKKIAVSAFTNKATSVIKEKTPLADAFTLFKMLGLKPNENSDKIVFEKQNQSVVSLYDIIVLDEISMVDDVYLNMLIDELNNTYSNTKLILIGDKAQLPPINQNTPSIAFSFENSFELRELVRHSKHSNIFKYSLCVREILEQSKIAPITTKLIPKDINDEINDLVITKDARWFLESFIKDFRSEDYKKNSDHVKVIAYRNKTIDVINNLIRKEIFGNTEESIFEQENLVLDAHVGMIYDPSDEIQIVRIYSKEVYKAKHNSVDISFPYYVCKVRRTYDGLEHEMNIVDLRFKDKYNEQLQEWARDIKKYTDAKKIFKEEFYPFKKRYHTPFYGYAMTAHKVQGSTISNVYVIEDDIENVKLAKAEDLWRAKYVAYTRASEKLVVLNRN